MTTTKNIDLRQVLNSGNLNKTAAALRLILFGNKLGLVKATFAALADVAGHDITTAVSKTGLTALDGITLDTDENLPPIGSVVALRSVAGSLAVQGTHVVGDAGATALVPNAAYSGVATLSADGKTVTFQAGVTGFVLWYYPKEAVDLDTEFPFGAP